MNAPAVLHSSVSALATLTVVVVVAVSIMLASVHRHGVVVAVVVAASPIATLNELLRWKQRLLLL